MGLSCVLDISFVLEKAKRHSCGLSVSKAATLSYIVPVVG